MATKRIDYDQRIKAIRPYVSLPYKSKTSRPRVLSQSQKRRITFYYNEIAALKNRPYKISKPTNKKNLQAAQEYSGQPNLKYLKVAFVPVGKGKAKIKFKKGKIIVEQEHVTSSDILFDINLLAENPLQYVKDTIAKSPGKSFNIMAGRYEIPTGHNRDSLPGAVLRYTHLYGNETVKIHGRDVANNHYFKNWLIGVRAHQFKKQATFNKYNADKKKAIDEGKQRRKKLKKKKGLT